MAPLILILLQASVIGHFSIAETAGVPFNGCARAGVVLDAKKAFDPETLCVRSAGRTVRAQVRVIDRHPDESLRRVALVFPTRLSPFGVGACEVLTRPHGENEESPRIAWDETDAGIRIHVRGLTLVVPSDPAVAAHSIETDANTRIGRVVIPEATGIPGSVVVEECGPWRVTCLQRGAIKNASGIELGVLRRVTVDADGDEITFETTLVTDAFFGKTDAIELAFESAERFSSVTTEWGTEVPTRDGDRFGSEAEESGVTTPLGFPKTRPSGKRSVGAVRGRATFGTAEWNVEDFDRLGPGSVLSLGTKSLRATLTADDYHWWPGVRPTKAVRLFILAPKSHLSPLLPWSRPIAFRRVAENARNVGIAPPDAIVGKGASIAKRLFDAFDARKAERFGLDWRGAENFGDWRWSLSDGGNLEFDTTWGLAVAGGERSDPMLVYRAHRAARHLVARDLDLARTGVPIRHGAHHRMGGLEAGHVWIEGLAEVADQTADPILVDAVQTLMPALLRFTDGATIERWNTRSVGWALVYLAVLAERLPIGDVRPLVARILDRVEKAPGDAFILLEAPDPETSETVFSTWVSAGILGAGLAAVRAIDDRPALRARFDRTMDTATIEAWDPKEKVLADRIIVDRAGEGMRTRGECTGEQMLFFALGGRFVRDPSSAAARTRRSIVAEAVKRLDFDRKTLKGKELSQLLWLGPRLFGAAFIGD